MEKLKEITLRESQLASLDILKKVIEICEKIDVQYWAIFGTLLGAVRHNGFIPWDDDLDIAMKSDDYDKFISYFESNRDEFYPLVIHNKSAIGNCFYNITRICDERYILEFDEYNYQSGIFIDLYPFEGMGREDMIPFWQKRFKKMLRYKKNINMNCSKSIFYGNGILHKLLNLPGLAYAKIKGSRYFWEKLDSYPKFKWESSSFVGVPRWENYIYRNYYYGFIEKEFEDIMIWIPKAYNEILEESYGDYMKYPPENERFPHHGYKAYKKEN